MSEAPSSGRAGPSSCGGLLAGGVGPGLPIVGRAGAQVRPLGYAAFASWAVAGADAVAVSVVQVGEAADVAARAHVGSSSGRTGPKPGGASNGQEPPSASTLLRT